MAVISSTQGNAQASEIAVQNALAFLGSLSREDLQAVLDIANADLAKLYEDRNMLLTQGGLVTFLGTSVQFTEALKIEINSQVAGGAPTIIDLASTTRNVATDGDMIYATINRSAGTAVVTDNSATLPAVVAANKEVVLLAKRVDDPSGLKRLYWMNGTAFDEGQTARLGASGSGAGDANSILETIKNTLQDSLFEFVTANIFSINEDDLMDTGTSTAAFSLVSSNVEFTAGAEFFQSLQMLDSTDFLTEGLDVATIQLSAFWNALAIDPAATYAVSRDGGVEFQTVTMERVGNATENFVGQHEFTAEAANASQVSNATTDQQTELDTTTQQKLSQEFVLADATVIRELDLDLTINGSPAGKLEIQIVNDDTSLPSLDTADIQVSTSVDSSSLSTGTNTIAIPRTVLPAGTYHIVLSGDTDYDSSFSTGVTSIEADSNSAGTLGATFNGTVWAGAAFDIVFDLKGYVLDLRVKITSSAAANLDGYGILYDLQTSGIIGGIKERQVFTFNTVTDPNEFTLNFVPEPDLLRVYLVETGQVFKRPAFQLDGKKIIFPVGAFAQSPDIDITLIADQSQGASFDNSDVNGLLMAGNFLGSTDAQIDRSVAGRGIFLRRPDGTLRELTINNSDTIVVLSV